MSREGTQGGYNRGAWCTDLQSVSCGINGRADSKGETGAQGGGWKDEPLPLKFTNTEVDDKTSGPKIPLHLGSVREQESLRAWGSQAQNKRSPFERHPVSARSVCCRRTALYPRDHARDHGMPPPSVPDGDREGEVSGDISRLSSERLTDSVAS